MQTPRAQHKPLAFSLLGPARNKKAEIVNLFRVAGRHTHRFFFGACRRPHRSLQNGWHGNTKKKFQWRWWKKSLASLTSAKASRKEAKEAFDAATAKWDEVRRREFIRVPLAARDGVVIEMGVLELEKKNSLNPSYAKPYQRFFTQSSTKQTEVKLRKKLDTGASSSHHDSRSSPRKQSRRKRT